MRKNRPLSSAVDSAGEVAEGEIITMPFGTATLASTAPVTPEQSAPMIATTPSLVIRRSAAAVAAAASTQVLSARTGTSVLPSSHLPLSLISVIASSALSAMWPVSDSIGPVKPRITPTLTSALWLAAKPAVAEQRDDRQSSKAVFSFFSSPCWIVVLAGNLKPAQAKEKPVLLGFEDRLTTW